tara:strand:+ start:170 stop:373 length:204 start_codon:yes stop_codon:yes gene_type:complete
MITKYSLKIRPFREAREFARKLHLSKKSEWQEWCLKNMNSKPNDIPVLPNVAYKNIGWISYEDWLKD